MLDRFQPIGHRGDERNEANVHAQDPVLRMVDDVHELIGVEARVHGVADGPHAGHAVVQLEMAETVPGDRSHAIPCFDAQLCQAVGKLGRTPPRVCPRVAVYRAFRGLRDDLYVPVNLGSVVDQGGDEEGSIHHQATHGGAPIENGGPCRRNPSSGGRARRLMFFREVVRPDAVEQGTPPRVGIRLARNDRDPEPESRDGALVRSSPGLFHRLVEVVLDNCHVGEKLVGHISLRRVRAHGGHQRVGLLVSSRTVQSHGLGGDEIRMAAGHIGRHSERLGGLVESLFLHKAPA